VSSEAAAGKNPVSHVGKIYNVLSHRIASEIYLNVPDIREVYVWLVSQIGEPIDLPKIAAAQVIMERGDVGSVRKDINEVIDRELANIQAFCMELAYGEDTGVLMLANLNDLFSMKAGRLWNYIFPMQ